MSTLMTLDRGLSALEIISRRPDGMTIAELAEELKVHRAICYRIIATLEQHNLVARKSQGRVHLGAGAVVFSERYLTHLRQVAQPVLLELANAARATAFLSVVEGQDAVAIAVAESENAFLNVGYRTGSRHPLTQGAAGTAILSLRSPAAHDTVAVRKARENGIAFSVGEIEQGAFGAAAGILSTQASRRIEASIGVVTLNDLSQSSVADLVKHAATKLSQQL